jgi:hypothetical protein
MVNAIEQYTQALARQYAAQHNAGRVASTPKRTSGLVSATYAMGNPSAANAPTDFKGSVLSGANKVIDILSQPLYAATQTGKELAGDLYSMFHAKNAGEAIGKGAAAIADIPGYFGNFGSNNQKKTWSDVLRGNVDYINSFNQRAGINKTVAQERGPLSDYQKHFGWEKGLESLHLSTGVNTVLGLGADIVGDPSTYIGTGLVGKALRVLPGAAKAETAAKDAIKAGLSTAAASTSTSYGAKLGRDAAKVAQKFGYKLADTLGDAAGTAKASSELRDINAAKIDAAVPQPEMAMAGARATEIPSTTTYRDLGAEMTPGGDFGYQFNAPARPQTFGEIAPPPIAAPVAETAQKTRALLEDQQTGARLMKKEAPGWKNATIEGSKTPVYAGESRAYLENMPDMFRMTKPAEQVLAEVPKVLKTTEKPIVEIAKSAKVLPKELSYKEWLKTNGSAVAENAGAITANKIPMMQLEKIASSESEAGKFMDHLLTTGQMQLRAGVKSADLRQKIMASARKILDNHYGQARSEMQAQLEAARSATVAQQTPEEWIKSLVAGGDPMAKQYAKLTAKKTLTDADKVQIAALSKSLQGRAAEAGVRSAERVNIAPALVARTADEKASAAATEAAARASQAATRADRAATASERRLSGAALNSYLNRLYQNVLPEHAYQIQIARSQAEIDQIVKNLLTLKNPGSARYVEIHVPVLKAGHDITTAEKATDAEVAAVSREVAADPVIQARQNVPTAQEVLDATATPDPAYIASVARGEHFTTVEAQKALYFALEKQKMVDFEQIAPELRIGDKSEAFPWRTNKGVPRNSQTPGVGSARHISYNSQMMENLWDGVWKANAEKIDAIYKSLRETKGMAWGEGLGGLGARTRAERIYNEILRPQLREIESFLKANQVVGVASSSAKGVPLYMTDFLDALNATAAGQNILWGRVIDAYGFGTKLMKGDKGRRIADRSLPGSIPMSNLMNLGGYLTKMAASTDARTLLATSGQYDALAKDMAKAFAHDAGSEFHSIANGVRQVNGAMKSTPIGKISPGGVRTPLDITANEAIVNDLHAVLTDPETVASLFTSINRNTADSAAIFASDVQSVSKDAVTKILTTLRDMSGRVSNADRADALLFPERITKSVTDDAAVSKFAAERADETVKATTPEKDIVAAQSAKSVSDAANTARTTVQDSKITNKMQDGFDTNLRLGLEEDGAKIALAEDLVNFSMQTWVGKTVDFLANHFVARYGNMTMHAAIQQFGSVGNVMSRSYARELGDLDTAIKDLAKTRGLTEPDAYKTVAQEIFAAVKSGPDAIAALNADAKALAGNMRNLVDYFFQVPRSADDLGTTGVLGTWFREGFDINQINYKLGQKRFGLGEDMILKMTEKGKVVKKGKSVTKNLTPAQVSEQWKTWKIDDPIDFLHRMERVTTELATEASIAREGYRLGKVAGMISTKPRPGFLKLTRASFGDESIVRYMPKSPTGEIFIHPDLVGEFKRMDTLLRHANDGASGFNRWARQNLDPILAMWKSGMTIWRPGHHFRNIIGDTSMAMLHNGTYDPVYYLRAVGMLSTKQNTMGRSLRGSYGVWDALKAMEGLNRAAEGGAFNKKLTEEILKLGKEGGKENTIVANVTINGQKFEVDRAAVYRALMDRGVLPDFKKVEDIIDTEGLGLTSTQRLANVTHFQGSKVQDAFKFGHKKLAGFSEGRDDFVRIGDALSMMENGINGGSKNWKSVEDMFDQVAARIRQAHPDGSDLTPFEKNFMRRLIPFYSWNRKAAPLVLENMLTHPGRFMMYPKAMYNFGQANGLNLESLSYPFPEDQVFPDFVTDKMTGIGWRGADGRYWSFDIGVANADITNTALANGGSTVTSSLYGLGGMLNPMVKMPFELMSGTQLNSVPITDKSDYVDSNIPGFNVINSVFGVSPSSVVERLLNGNPGIDTNRAVAKGNRAGIGGSPEYAFNWLTGAKILDTSKPNYIKLANMQMVDKMRKAAGQ